MNEKDVQSMYNHIGSKGKVTAYCINPNNNPLCNKTEIVNKNSAIRNIKKNNDVFLCRSCSFTEEGKEKIAQTTSYKRSDETRQKMSESAIAKFNGSGGEELKKRLSRASANQQKPNLGTAIKARRNCYYQTKKAGLVYCESSYEVRAAFILDEDSNVKTYCTQVPFETLEGMGRRLDFVVELQDGSQKIIETKPANRLLEFEDQIQDGKNYALSINTQYEIWTEKDLGFNISIEITHWADMVLGQQDGIDYVAIRKQKVCEKTKRYYHKNIANDKVILFCEYCHEEHAVLRKSYDTNLERNGRYICEKEGGHIAGSLPKPHLQKPNPYEAEGKKECNICHEILSLEDFGSDKTKPDGLSRRCKACRRKKANAAYHKKVDPT